MHCGKFYALLVVLGLGSALRAAPLEAIPLNDHTRLGQRFSVTRTFSALAVTVPSWLDAEGGLTLTLWDSPQRSRQLARQVFASIQDNAPAELVFAKPLPPGSYYWEISERTGQTRIGLYADRLPEPTEDCAYLDDTPDPMRRFMFRAIPAPFPFVGMEELAAALAPDRPLWERTEACRQLAVQGGREAIPLLAGLLGDEALSHMARFALEPMPDAGADRALREALGTLQGSQLVGVVNSLAVRRDPKAVRPLRKLLAADPAVAAAAAVALGRIGTPPAAEALDEACEAAPAALCPALHEALLEGAVRLAEQGHTRRAAAVYDRLLNRDTGVAVRRAALRGAIVTRGEAGVPLLLERLRGADPEAADVALWVAQHDLPGVEVSTALAEALPTLPPERQGQVAAALSARPDPAALVAVLSLARGAGRTDKALRLAALRSLPRTRPQAVAAVPALLAGIDDSDQEIAGAAADVLSELPVGIAEAELQAALGTSRGESRLRVIQLVGARRVSSAVPALLRLAADPEPAARAAALRVLGELAGTEQVPPLLEFLAKAATPEDRDALEKALRGALGRAADPGPEAERLAVLLPQAPAALKQSLLRLLHSLGGAAALAAVRQVTTEADPEARSAAYRLLGEWKTADAAPALLGLAADAADPADRLLCLRGAIRLAGSKDLPPEQRLALCRQAAPLISRDDERKQLLGVLGGVPMAEALALATPYLSEPATQAEAVAAVLAIAEPLAGTPDPAQVSAALEQVIRTLPGTDPARRAEAILAKLRPAPESKR